MPSLHWIGKGKVVGHHLEVPYRVLDKLYSQGEGEAAERNRIIHGDNRERRDFKLNGFVNHYPDFIAVMRSGNVLLVEAKGDDRDNSDSERKLELGKQWERLAGPNYKYFMVFQSREVPGAWPMAEATRLIARL